MKILFAVRHFQMSHPQQGWFWYILYPLFRMVELLLCCFIATLFVFYYYYFFFSVYLGYRKLFDAAGRQNKL
jgi:hypothetical protein